MPLIIRKYGQTHTYNQPFLERIRARMDITSIKLAENAINYSLYEQQSGKLGLFTLEHTTLFTTLTMSHQFCKLLVSKDHFRINVISR